MATLHYSTVEKRFSPDVMSRETVSKNPYGSKLRKLGSWSLRRETLWRMSRFSFECPPKEGR